MGPATRRTTLLSEAARALTGVVRQRHLRAAQASFLLFWTAEWAFTVGVGVLAFRDGGAVAVGVVGLLRMAPAALLAPLAAPLADRFRRERVLAVVAVVRAASFLGVASVVAAGSVRPAYALVALASTAGVLYRPSHSALLPSLCRTAQDLAAATAARGLLDSAGALVGPLVATVLLSRGDLTGVFVAAAVLSAASAAALLGLSYEQVPREQPPAPPALVADVVAGARAVQDSPHLRVLFALAAVQTLVRGAVQVFVVVLAIDVLDAGEAGAGALATAIGAGAVLGSVGALLLADSRRLAAWCGVGTVLWGLPLVAAGAAPSLLVVAVLFAVLGVGNALLDVGLFSLPARLVPDAVLGRVFAVLESIAALSVAAGGLLAPAVIDVVGVRPSVALVGVVAPLVVVLLWRRLLHLDAAMVERDARVALLTGLPVLAPLPMPAIEHLAARAERRTVRAGVVVVAQGQPAEEFFVVADGRAEVVHDGELLRVVGPGDGFGEVALLRETPRTATVRALDHLELWVLRREHFSTAVHGCSRSAAEADALLRSLRFVPAAPTRPQRRR